MYNLYKSLKLSILCVVSTIESVFLCVYSFNDVASLGPSILSAKLLAQVKLIAVAASILTNVSPTLRFRLRCCNSWPARTSNLTQSEHKR